MCKNEYVGCGSLTAHREQSNPGSFEGLRGLTCSVNVGLPSQGPAPQIVWGFSLVVPAAMAASECRLNGRDATNTHATFRATLAGRPGISPTSGSACASLTHSRMAGKFRIPAQALGRDTDQTRRKESDAMRNWSCRIMSGWIGKEPPRSPWGSLLLGENDG